MKIVVVGLLTALFGTSAYAQAPNTSTTTGGSVQSPGGRGGASVGVESRESGTSVRTRTETSEQPSVATRRSTTVSEEPATSERRTVKRSKSSGKVATKRKRGKAARSTTVEEERSLPASRRTTIREESGTSVQRSRTSARAHRQAALASHPTAQRLARSDRSAREMRQGGLRNLVIRLWLT